ncbi:DnaJ domain containing protein [Diplonema papillatum]|nr:DnaJ domain containing protein [Diplonema papillatum]
MICRRCCSRGLRAQTRCSSAYETLGVGRTASLAEVRARYLALARKHHPDMGGTEAGMKRVNDAYATVQRAKAHERPPRTTAAGSSSSGGGRRAAARRQRGDAFDDDFDDREMTEEEAERERRILSWLVEERRRYDAELRRRAREQELEDELEKRNAAAFRAAVADWLAKRQASDAAEARYAAGAAAQFFDEAHTAWLAAWTSFNAAAKAWAAWKADPHSRIGNWSKAELYSKGLWDSDARQWRGQAWAAYAVWKQRLKERGSSDP